MLRSMIPVRRKFPGTFSRLENEFEPFWDPFDRFLKQEDWEMVPQQVFPSVNVAETNEMFEVTAELPGMDPKDVKVEIQNGILWISGEKKEMKEVKDRTFHRIESTFGEFNRRIALPGLVKESEIDAVFENGVLKIAIPKSEELKPKQIKVKAH